MPTDTLERPSTSAAVHMATSPQTPRTLDELNDDDAIALARLFTQTSWPVIVSLLGLSVLIIVGAFLLGFSDPIGIGVAGAISAGLVGYAAHRRARDAITSELGVRPQVATALYAATGARSLLRRSAPKSEAELRAFGQEIIAEARRRATDKT